jgi:hypothetical protein
LRSWFRNSPRVASNDLNGDGKQDLVVNDGADVSIYLGNGDGTFTAGASYSTIEDVGYVTITDLDGDGNADVYIGLANGGYFAGDQFNFGSSYVLMGNGDGTLSGAPSVPFMYNGSNIADLNNDGVLDGVGLTANEITGTAFFTSYLGNKNGTFTEKSTLQISPATVNGQLCYFGGVDSYALGDVNGDGFADIVYIVPDCNSGGFYVATGKGDGTFNAPVFIQSTISGPGININSIQVADFNHDGKADITYLYSTVGTDGTATNEGFAVQLGNGNSTFQPPLVTQTSSTPGTQVATPFSQISAIGDVNGDGFPDLFVVESIPPICTPQGCGPVTGYTFQLYLGNGDGTFKSPYTMPTNPGLTSGLQNPYSQVVIADMNGDGHPDVVALDPISAGGLAIYLGNGTGTFATPSFINAGGSGVAVADFNGDGKLDVAVMGGEFSGIYLGNGDGTLQSLPDSNGYPQPSQSILFNDFFDPAITADFNHDGKPDILFGNTLLLSPSAAVTTPTLAATMTQLTATPTTASAGTTIAFKASVSETAGTSTPTGTVTFSDGTTSIGTANLASGVATFSTASLSVGTHNITAAYGGDTTNATSSSSAVVVTIAAAVAPDFSIALSPSSGSVSQGSSVTSTLTVTSSGGFNQAVNFTCSGLPANATCTFSPASVTPNGTSSPTSMLTITTNVTAASLSTKLLRTPEGAPSLGMLAGGGSLVLLLLRRRRLRRLQMSLAAAFLLTFAAIGCSHGNSMTTTTPTGTSQTTVTATAGSTVHTATYGLTVQ